ncbi:hypothetical protein E1301_Tti022011 [Triplophysa tibetana]|uniref:Uncharacterized protein n=1 Tax=Triplophysa tibetana TaxID=1572043 RepID=A0A5A9N1V2_9TELE|nr:hypothetical protein E1301_Tti022011 [Triplophysa tibetana]
MEVLLPSSRSKSGEEHSLFVDGGYVTLTGKKHNVLELKSIEEDIEVMAVSEKEGGLCLMTEDFKEFMVPFDICQLTSDDILVDLPMKFHVVHISEKITQIEHFPSEM